jgi:dTDP-4-amino-4,6-dideoxygalactose transaminase
VAEKITPNTKAIIPVHIAGNPADLDGIMALANQHNLFVMEDTAQAPGAEWKGTPVGGIGHLGTFSFQSSKNLASGEGGALVTNDEALADRIRSFVNCGRVKGGAWYDHHEQGGNHRLGAFQAAILRVGLTRIQEQMTQRSENACYLAKRLDEIPGVQLTGVHNGCTRHAYHLCIFRYDKNEFKQLSKKTFLEALNKEGIECAWGYLPLYKYHFFQHFSQKARMYDALYQGVDYSNTHCPVTEHICDHEGVWLFQEMLLGNKQDMDDIANAILKIKENVDEALAFERN